MAKKADNKAEVDEGKRIFKSKAFKALQKEWDKKLKDNGFKDIESRELGIIKAGHIRPSDYISRGSFAEAMKYGFEYYRCLGIFSAHYPSIPDNYKKVIRCYADTGNLKACCKGDEKLRLAVQKYLKTNHKIIMAFVAGVEALDD